MREQRCSVSKIRAGLYQATGRRLVVLGLGVLVVLALTAVGTCVFELALIEFLVSHGYNVMAAAGTAGGTVVVSLMGLAAVVRAFSPLLHEVAGILEARKPGSAGLVMSPDDATARSHHA
jgi:hypothetical protein